MQVLLTRLIPLILVTSTAGCMSADPPGIPGIAERVKLLPAGHNALTAMEKAVAVGFLASVVEKAPIGDAPLDYIFDLKHDVPAPLEKDAKGLMFSYVDTGVSVLFDDKGFASVHIPAYVGASSNPGSLEVKRPDGKSAELHGTYVSAGGEKPLRFEDIDQAKVAADVDLVVDAIKAGGGGLW